MGVKSCYNCEHLTHNENYSDVTCGLRECGGKCYDYSSWSPDEKLLKKRLENFMRGLWEERCMGGETYTTEEVFDMINREVFERSRNENT